MGKPALRVIGLLCSWALWPLYLIQLFQLSWLCFILARPPKYILTDKTPPQESPTSPDSGISSASSTEDNLAKKELNFDSDNKDYPVHFTFPKSKPPKTKAESSSVTCTSTTPAVNLPPFSMPSVISATTAVAVANSVMSGNLASLPKEVTEATECSAEEAEDRTVKRPMEQDDDGDDDEEDMSSDEMCLEAKEVVQYTSSESSSEDDDFKDDGEDSDYGGRKGSQVWFRDWRSWLNHLVVVFLESSFCSRK